LDLLVEVSTDGFLSPRLVIEVGLPLLLWISGHVGHRLQVWKERKNDRFSSSLKQQHIKHAMLIFVSIGIKLSPLDGIALLNTLGLASTPALPPHFHQK
jgi:hypothetical protein